MKKLIARFFTVVAFLVLATIAQAQIRTTPGTGTTTFSATGRTLLYTSAGSVPVNLSAMYHTTGGPATLSCSIETSEVLAAVATPFTKIAALTNTTSGQWAEANGGHRYWYVNCPTLTGGTSPTIVVTFRVTNITTPGTALGTMVLAATTTLVTPEIGVATGTSLALGGGTALTTTNRTGTGNLVLETTPTLVTPVIGAASGTSLDLSSFIDTGVAGSTVGELRLHNATSGTITISPATGALGTITATVPASATAWVIGSISVPWRDELTGSAVDRVFFTATRGWIIDSCSQVHSVAAGGVSTMQLVKDTTTSAPGAGTDLLTAAFDLNATANTVQAKASGDFVSLAARTMAIGDRIAVDYANAIQSTAGNAVTCLLIPN